MGATSVDPAVQAAIDSAIGVGGALLSLHFYTGTMPGIGTPADSVSQLPLSVHDPAAPGHIQQFVADSTGALKAPGSPVELRYNPAAGAVRSNGWFLGQAGADLVVRVILTAPHEKPIVLSPTNPPVTLQPVIQAGVVKQGGATSPPRIAAEVKPQRAVGGVGRHLIRGQRRRTIVETLALLRRVGEEDDIGYSADLAAGRDADVFVANAATSGAVSVILTRLEECLRLRG